MDRISRYKIRFLEEKKMVGILFGIGLMLLGTNLLLIAIFVTLKESNRLKKLELKRLGFSQKEIDGE